VGNNCGMLSESGQGVPESRIECVGEAVRFQVT
jgi:hypothetical protein